ncbi:FadR/GntR family transcriptional regulator [Cytobacillus oceanisediminis]|uniref:FadR/GntR family transcriptional regulator n=1 Tax=Cytobacillus oceanisediminis TaxID=665099 RepID=UPI0023DCCD20|nr:FadR/GntR family transcriptional regulator [Cytobacillus oceanisediminis]MDF2038234.1 FadR/GntR family transcriptional regulator [Cytobacillus oceanisediminis]
MKIERKKISAQVLDQLKEMIKEGKFTANEPMPSENELAKLFGVSRAPVREALSVLSASGIIESRQGGRSFVKEVNMADMLGSLAIEYIPVEQVFELLEMRMIMETQAAAIAALRRDEADLEKMKLALDQFEITLTNPEAVGDLADVNFHKHLIAATKNRFMIQVMENIDDLYRKAIAFSLQKNVGLPAKREQVYQEHMSIFTAIKEQDEERAAKAMRVHLENVTKKLKVNEVEGKKVPL